jgi:hypothetical protein
MIAKWIHHVAVVHDRTTQPHISDRDGLTLECRSCESSHGIPPVRLQSFMLMLTQSRSRFGRLVDRSSQIDALQIGVLSDGAGGTLRGPRAQLFITLQIVFNSLLRETGSKKFKVNVRIRSFGNRKPMRNVDSG